MILNYKVIKSYFSEVPFHEGIIAPALVIIFYIPAYNGV